MCGVALQEATWAARDGRRVTASENFDRRLVFRLAATREAGAAPIPPREFGVVSAACGWACREREAQIRAVMARDTAPSLRVARLAHLRARRGE